MICFCRFHCYFVQEFELFFTHQSVVVFPYKKGFLLYKNFNGGSGDCLG